METRSVGNLVALLTILPVLMLGSAAPVRAVTYTTVDSSGTSNWNTAPWSIGEPNGTNNYVGLLRGGGTIEINTDEVAGGLLIGWYTAYTVDMTDGSLTLGSTDRDQYLFLSENGAGQGTLNHSGGTLTTPRVILNRGGNANNALYNLSGTAVLETPWIDNQGSVGKVATLNLNGGLLRATGSHASWLDPGITSNVLAGGAGVDTQAYDITFASPLLDGGGDGGLTKYGSGTLRLTASSTYAGNTVVDDGILVVEVDDALPTSTVVQLNNDAALDMLDGTSQQVAGLMSTSNAAQLYTSQANPRTLTIDVADATTHTYAGTVSASNLKIVKSGNGTQVFEKRMDNTGRVEVSAGTLQIGVGQVDREIGTADFDVAAGAKLVFDRNDDDTRFTTTSISGAGDVEFRGQQEGYFTLRAGQYNGTLSNTGRMIVNLDDDPGNAWWQGVLWLEKDNVLSHESVLDLQSGKVYTRNQTGNGLTVAGISGNAGTYITSDRTATQKWTVDVADGQTYTYAGTIGADGTGTGKNYQSLTKTGPGTQILTGTNTYTGGTTVDQGTLQIGTGEDFGHVGHGDYDVAAGAKLVFHRNHNNTTFTTTSISGAGDVEFRGQQDGYFVFRVGEYTGSLTHTGRTIVNLDDDPGNAWDHGTLWVSKDDALPHESLLDLQSGKVYTRYQTNNGLTVAGISGSAGTYITTDQTSVQKLTADVADGQTYTYSGVIGADGTGTGTDNLSLAKTGPGTQILAGVHTYSGGTTIDQGTLQIGTGEFSVDVGRGDYHVAAGAKLVFHRNRDMTDFDAFDNNISGAGDVEFRGQQTGYFRFQGYGGTLSNTGRMIVNLDDDPGNSWWQGVLWLEDADVLSHGSVLDVQSGKVYTRNQTGNGLTVAGISGNAGTYITSDRTATQKWTVDVADGQTYTYAGTIGADGTGTGKNYQSLTKTGPGTQILTGTNTYTGGTIITDGALRIDGTLSGPGGNVAVQSGGTLGGSGLIERAVLVAAGGTLGPGSSPGILEVESVDFAPGSFFHVEVDGTSPGTGYDQLIVDGLVDLGGATLQLDLLSSVVVGTELVIVDNLGEDDVVGTFDGLAEGDRLSVIFEQMSYAFAITYAGGTGNDVVISAVPEPSAWLLATVGMLAFVCWRRRNRSS